MGKKHAVNTKQMLDQIRDAIYQCDAPEREVYDALVDEAFGWKMRLEELEQEDEGVAP